MRFIEAGDDARQVVGKGAGVGGPGSVPFKGGDAPLAMVGAEASRNASRVALFAPRRFVEAEAEGAYRAVEATPHHRDDAT